MTGFFRRRNDGLEDRLRGLGSEPRSDLVSELSGEIRASRIPARMRTRRFAAALVTTAMMLIPFAAFGGVGLAAHLHLCAAIPNASYLEVWHDPPVMTSDIFQWYLKEPLRAVESFSGMLEKRHLASLDPAGQDLLRRVRTYVSGFLPVAIL